MTPISSACGFGNMYDDSHAATCIQCNHARWREHRREKREARRKERGTSDRWSYKLKLPPRDGDA